MLRNPVYAREIKVNSRSIRTPAILAAFNSILAVFALANMAVAVNGARESGVMDYSAFIDIFVYVAVIEFVLVLFVTPALTAGSISGERERRTLDIMLTTKLTPAGIVLGKLLAALSNVLVMLISSLPVLALVFVYGGVTAGGLGLVLVSFITAAVTTACTGLLASSCCRRSSMATAVSYASVAVLVGGTAGLCFIANNLTGSAGFTYYLLLINPASSFYAAISGIMGETDAMITLAQHFNTTVGLSTAAWFAVSTGAQLAGSFILILFSVRNVGPGRKVW